MEVVVGDVKYIVSKIKERRWRPQDSDIDALLTLPAQSQNLEHKILMEKILFRFISEVKGFINIFSFFINDKVKRILHPRITRER